MSNLRIIADNASDRATLTAGSTAGSLAVTNLQNDRKGQPWRALSTAARIGATWTTSERIGGMFLPFCNMSPTATVRVRVSNEQAKTMLSAYSERLNQTSSWFLSRAGVIPNHPSAPRAPDGTYSVDKLVVDTTAAASHYIYKGDIGAFAAGDLVTWSIFVAAAELDQVYMQFSNGGAAFPASVGANFSMTTGASSLVSSGVTAKSTYAGSGIWRVSITAAAGAAGAVRALTYLASSAGTATGRTTLATADGVSGVYLWGGVLEAGALSSYCPSSDAFGSRASSGTFIGSNGLIQASASGARWQYNSADLAAAPTLLLEAAATNPVLRSEEIDNATWTKTTGGTGSAPVATANLGVAPDGATTADQVVFALGVGVTSADISQLATGALAYTSGTTYTTSVFMRTTDGTTKAVMLVSPDGISALVTVTGVWQRFSTTTTPGSTTTGTMRLRLRGSEATAAAASLYVWGAQFEAGGYATSYIPTTSAAVTRSADLSTSTPGARPAGYIDNFQSYDYDSGVVLACPAAAVKLRGFTAAQAASAYAYGGGACARHWLPAQMQALGLAIDIADPANLQGYVEAARLVVGEYWSPTYNADYGASMTPMDFSQRSRADSGDPLTNIGTRARKMSLSLSAMPPADRTALFNVLRANGTAWPMLISLYPGDSDLELERDHTIYGKLSTISAMALPSFDRYSTPLEIEEV